MKKWISLLLVLVMVAAMAAGCKKAGTDKTPIADDMQTVVTKIIEKNPVEFMGGVMPVDLTDTSEDGQYALTYYTGLESAEQLRDIAVYEPMISSIAYSMVLVRVNEGVDAKAVAQQMNDGIDTRKWGCVMADEKIVVGYGDVVMLIMLDSNLGLKAQSFVDAFQTVCGAELDFQI